MSTDQFVGTGSISHWRIFLAPDLTKLSPKCLKQIPLLAVNLKYFWLQNLTHFLYNSSFFVSSGNENTAPGFDMITFPSTFFLWLVLHPATEQVLVIPAQQKYVSPAAQQNWNDVKTVDSKHCTAMNDVKQMKPLHCYVSHCIANNLTSVELMTIHCNIANDYYYYTIL